jgi:hypothetical protein
VTEKKTAPIPTHVQASVDKDGRKRSAHIAVRHKKITASGEDSRGADDPISAFIAKHGGVEHLRESLNAMTSDQRAKLIDAMAHVGDITPAEVMKKLGMHEPQVSEKKKHIEDQQFVADRVRSRLDQALEDKAISAEEYAQLIQTLNAEGWVAAIQAATNLQESRQVIPETPVHIVETDPQAIEAARRHAANNAIKQEQADSLYERHVDAANKSVRMAFEVKKREARKWRVPAQMREALAEHQANAGRYLDDWRQFCAASGIVLHEPVEL